MTTDHQPPQPAPEAPRLSAEREESIRRHLHPGEHVSPTCDGCVTYTLLLERDEARAALAPFARAYWARHPGQDDRPIMTVWDDQQHEFRLTAGDFHRAADALASSPAAPKEPAPCPSCGEGPDKHITLCTKNSSMVEMPNVHGAAGGIPVQLTNLARGTQIVASAPDDDKAACGCPRKPAKLVWHTRACTLERHAESLPLPDDMLDEPAPDEGARGGEAE